MPDTATVATGLVGELREQIKDTAWVHTQFSVRVSATGVTSAILEIEEGAFSIAVVGGSVPSVDVQLTSTSYNTVGKIATYLASLGYDVQFAESGDPNHPSTDIGVQAPTSVLNNTYHIKTRRWSDAELNSLLRNAMRRHNTSVPHMTQLNYTGDYTLDNVPDNHKYFVVLLAQIEMLKTLVSDSSKRRGTDLNVADYDTWKRSLEDEYAAALDNLVKSAEATPPPVLTEQDQGDIIIGHSYRYRFGARYPNRSPMIPAALAPMPKPVTIVGISYEDGVVMLEWTRSRDLAFHKYEVWRGTTDDVSNRSRVVTPVNVITFDGTLVHTQPLQHKTVYIDGVATALTPGLYYYRIYTYNQNGDFSASQAVSVTVE